MGLAEPEVLLLLAAQTVVLAAAVGRSLEATLFLSKTYRLVTWAAFHRVADAAKGVSCLLVEMQWEFHQKGTLQVHQSAAGASSNTGESAVATGLSLLQRRRKTGPCHPWPQTRLRVISSPARRTMAASHFGAVRTPADALPTQAAAGPYPFGGADKPAAQVAMLAADQQGSGA